MCGEPIEDDAVLDHDHVTGFIRGVLHRGCNALLGKIENNMKRNKVSEQRLAALLSQVVYYRQHPQQGLVHPTHKTKPRK